MTVYVDDSFQYPSGWWCHMIADTPDELHEMARDIGLRRGWAQTSSAPLHILHYDLRPSKRAMAVKRGAVEISRRELVAIGKKQNASD